MNKSLILNHISLTHYDDRFSNSFIVIILGSLLLALSARIKIDIGPVPVTLQTLVLLVFSMSVGWKLSISTFVTYLFYGSLGLPFFANPPYGGLLYIAGPSGGYLFGMLIASFIVGYLAEKNFEKNYLKSLTSIFSGTFIIFFFGLIWLTYWLSIQPEGTINFLCNRESIACSFSNWNISQSFNLALILGLYKFIITEPIKILLAATITPIIWNSINK